MTHAQVLSIRSRWAARAAAPALILALSVSAGLGGEPASKAASAPARRAKQEKAPPTPLVVPEDVSLTRDIPYREGNEAWKLDLAMPKEPAKAARPALVFVHGGGWRSGDKGLAKFLGQAVNGAQKGYVCVSVNYRLSGEAPFPAAVEDVKCAVRWLRAHAQDYGVDPNRIGAMGISAGGHLVLMLGLAPKEAGLEGDGPWQEFSSMVQAVVSSCGPASFIGGRLEFLNRPGAFLSGPEETLEERTKQASPITYVGPNAPPMLIIQGTDDNTVPVAQADNLVEALKAAGAKDVTYMRLEGAGHGVFDQRIAETAPAMEAFFERTLKSK